MMTDLRFTLKQMLIATTFLAAILALVFTFPRLLIELALFAPALLITGAALFRPY